MGDLSLSDVVTGTGGRACGFGSAEISFADVVTDSRAVRRGSLFWALPGSSRDGHDFVGEALLRGAAGAVVRAGAGGLGSESPRIEVPDTLRALADLGRRTRRRHDVLAIGVTGSVGKTTTREMLHAVLSRAFRGTRSRGNLNNHVGLPLSLLEIGPEHEFAVLEMGASAVGEIRALAAVAEPEVGIVTAIAPAHVEGFGGLAGIVRGKGELVEALPASGFAVLAGDDPLVRSLAARGTCRAILYGESHDVDLRAEAVLHDFDGLAFRVDGCPYAVPATGRHHLSAALAAIAVGREFGMRPEDIAAGLLDFRPVAGRSRSERIGPWHVLDDTYNANPASMRAACDVLASWRGRGCRLFVAGDMLELGPEAAHFHRELGRQATEAGADRLVAFGRHADDVVRGAAATGMSPHRLAACEDLETVLLQLDCWLEPGDLVAVKGSRGMRMERIVDWLRERATEFPVATAALRDCA